MTAAAAVSSLSPARQASLERHRSQDEAILRLLALGLDQAAIARQLHYSTALIKNRVSEMRAAAGRVTTVRLVVLAMLDGRVPAHRQADGTYAIDPPEPGQGAR